MIALSHLSSTTIALSPLITMRRTVLLFIALLSLIHGFIARPKISRRSRLVPSTRHGVIVERYLSSTRQQQATSEASRLKRVASLVDWASRNDIKLGGVQIGQSESGAGLGLIADQDLPPGSLVVTVPSSAALSVESPGSGPNDSSLLQDIVKDRRAFRELPWFVQFSAYLFALDRISSIRKGKRDLEMRPWLDSLPRSFATPIHWSRLAREELQYKHLTDAIARQESEWTRLYEKLLSVGSDKLIEQMSFDDFLWGCECARSRAFSGGYTGAAFNPSIYAFTLLLVTAYVGLNLGTLEQAANGAALVVCASILKDFVWPKLQKTKRYIVCPLIDMANHNSVRTSGDVSFEFFGDAYSLAIAGETVVPKSSEVYISYGTRSNDQFLQFYGFVEQANPQDVYVMPPLREWDIAALEQACGRTFESGRLQKLERAGLLGSVMDPGETEDDSLDGAANPIGGVVVTRVGGVDPAVMQALRALVSSRAEWVAAGKAIGNFATENSGGVENERLARLAARTALRLELESKLTTIEEDERLLEQIQSTKSAECLGVEERLAILFRIEKKKLLAETIDKLSS
jgi:hypothetical protein